MIIIGVDFGDKRTGLAISDKNGFLASPAGTILDTRLEKVAEKIVDFANKNNAEKIILGYPKNMNNTEGPRAEKTRELKETIEKLSGIPLILMDERVTTVMAHNIFNESGVKGKKRKENIDTLSATIILQDYLDSAK